MSSKHETNRLWYQISAATTDIKLIPLLSKRPQ
jgi:hypothetical protein